MFCILWKCDMNVTSDFAYILIIEDENKNTQSLLLPLYAFLVDTYIEQYV